MDYVRVEDRVTEETHPNALRQLWTALKALVNNKINSTLVLDCM